jgi:hypothetical protein
LSDADRLVVNDRERQCYGVIMAILCKTDGACCFGIVGVRGICSDGVSPVSLCLLHRGKGDRSDLRKLARLQDWESSIGSPKCLVPRGLSSSAVSYKDALLSVPGGKPTLPASENPRFLSSGVGRSRRTRSCNGCLDVCVRQRHQLSFLIFTGG